ncbi:hypothetical protein KZP23_04225 [Echinicola marina]|uniref:hypothetical protein n=1 Tax=Echinicola marina TaxID=2859768 RepID=UPI001CF682B1|nr:hypothetical protein [Echinicola marina]UCS94246.1 hypothetical protein KZP23_04225 [Echinicola marina]
MKKLFVMFAISGLALTASCGKKDVQQSEEIIEVQPEEVEETIEEPVEELDESVEELIDSLEETTEEPLEDLNG